MSSGQQVEKPCVATPVTLDASTLTGDIFDSSVDTDDRGDITMEENDTIQLLGPINLGGTICQLGSSAMLRLGVKVQEQPVVCVVDSAAEVTIISDKFFQSLERKPPTKRKTTMHAAGRGMRMDAFVAGTFDLKVGSTTYRTDIYVAPIDDNMLLGLDFIFKSKTILDCAKQVLLINGEPVPLMYGSAELVPKVAKVTLQETIDINIPPNSVVRVSCEKPSDWNCYVIEQTTESNLLMPRGYYDSGTNPVVSLLNMTDRVVKLNKGECIGEAIEAEHLDDSGDSPCISEITTESDPTNQKLPQHLHQLYEKSSKHLLEDQNQQLYSLLLEFSDVFAKDEFDLGSFSEIEHEIETTNETSSKMF